MKRGIVRLRGVNEAFCLLQECPRAFSVAVLGFTCYPDVQGGSAILVPIAFGPEVRATYLDSGFACVLMRSGCLLISAYLPDSGKGHMKRHAGGSSFWWVLHAQRERSVKLYWPET